MRAAQRMSMLRIQTNAEAEYTKPLLEFELILVKKTASPPQVQHIALIIIGLISSGRRQKPLNTPNCSKVLLWCGL